MFGNNGREMVISLPKQTKYKKHQMSLSLHVLKKNKLLLLEFFPPFVPIVGDF